MDVESKVWCHVFTAHGMHILLPNRAINDNTRTFSLVLAVLQQPLPPAFGHSHVRSHNNAVLLASPTRNVFYNLDFRPSSCPTPSYAPLSAH